MTTCTTVKQLMQELINFNPEARLEPHVEVGGNQSTQCEITVDQSKVEALEKKIDDINNIINPA